MRELKVVGKDASIAPSTLEKGVKPVALVKKRKKGRRADQVKVSQRHPALKMARDLGIDPGRIEITAEPPMWGCVIHNTWDW